MMTWNFKKTGKKDSSPKPPKTKLQEWLNAGVFALVVSTILRGLIFSAYAIPSGSMQGTELIGDYLFVSKISYGPRMPNTPVCVPFLEPNVYGVKTYWDGIKLPYFRLPGFGSPQKGDIVVFNKPEEADPKYDRPVDERTSLIKRCQATPGDLLTIVNGQVYINGVAAKNADESQTDYRIVIKGEEFNPAVLDELNVKVSESTPNAVTIPYKNIALLKNYPDIISIRPVVRAKGDNDDQIFPHNPNFKWNLDNWGPMMLPRKGWTVPLNDSTITLYRQAIERYENNTVEISNNEIKINGKVASQYTFNMNYYWMMGDNRHNSLDSRYWGYVPEDHIFGKAIITWMSMDSTQSLFHKVRWSRILKPIK